MGYYATNLTAREGSDSQSYQSSSDDDLRVPSTAPNANEALYLLAISCRGFDVIRVVRIETIMPDRSPDRSTYLPLKNKNGNGAARLNGNGSYAYPSLPVVERPVEADGDSIDLRQLARMVKHRLRLIGAIAAGVTAIAAIATFNQEEKYKGSFKLLVEPVAEEQENALSVLQPDLGGLDYETQIEVLRSPRVMKPIIEDLAKQYPEVEYGELIKQKKSPLKNRTAR